MMAPKSFGNLHLGGILADFLRDNPSVRIQLLLRDDPPNSRHFIDEGLDLALKMSPSFENDIISRRIAHSTWQLCCSPEYILQYGAPQSPSELIDRNCLVHLRTNPDSNWIMKGPEGDIIVKVEGNFTANSSLALRSAALGGLGIAFLPTYCIAHDLKSGRLVRVLPAYRVAARPMFLLHPHRNHLPLKVRRLIDYIASRLTVQEWDQPHGQQSSTKKAT